MSFQSILEALMAMEQSPVDYLEYDVTADKKRVLYHSNSKLNKKMDR